MFPHHENEIAQSESATHKTFARHWFHVRFLLVEGRKMSKSEGNFYTLRDLLLKGYKASAIRFLLTSVPYRQQLNFTFEGLGCGNRRSGTSAYFLQRLKNHAVAGDCNSSSGEGAEIRCEAANAAKEKISLSVNERSQYGRGSRCDIRSCSYGECCCRRRVTLGIQGYCGAVLNALPTSTRYLSYSRTTTHSGRVLLWTGLSVKDGSKRHLQKFWLNSL